MQTVAIIGCGFLGSWYTQLLLKLSFSQEKPIRLILVDSDTWEMRNAANQSVGLLEAKMEGPKVDTFVSMARDEYGLQAMGHHIRLGLDNMSILKNADLIVDCVDNIPTRQLLNSIGNVFSTSVMHLGISKKGEGAVNWTTTEMTSFPYTPQAIAGRIMKDDDATKPPPCEMYKHLFNGMKVVEAGIKATSLWMGNDPWESSRYLVAEAINSQGMNPKDTEETIAAFIGDTGERLEYEGLITCWATNTNGIEVRTDPSTLVDGFYPVVEPS